MTDASSEPFALARRGAPLPARPRRPAPAPWYASFGFARPYVGARPEAPMGAGAAAPAETADATPYAAELDEPLPEAIGADANAAVPRPPVIAVKNAALAKTQTPLPASSEPPPAGARRSEGQVKRAAARSDAPCAPQERRIEAPAAPRLAEERHGGSKPARNTGSSGAAAPAAGESPAPQQPATRSPSAAPALEEPLYDAAPAKPRARIASPHPSLSSGSRPAAFPAGARAGLVSKKEPARPDTPVPKAARGSIFEPLPAPAKREAVQPRAMPMGAPPAAPSRQPAPVAPPEIAQLAEHARSVAAGARHRLAHRIGTVHVVVKNTEPPSRGAPSAPPLVPRAAEAPGRAGRSFRNPWNSYWRRGD